MGRNDDQGGSPAAAAAEYTIGEIAWPASSGVIGLTPCPGVRAGRFRPDLLVSDLDEVQRWGTTAMVCLLLEGEIGTLSLDRLIYEVRRRGIGCVQLHGTGRRHGIDLEAEWRRVRERLVQALRKGQRLLIPGTEGRGRAGPVAAWLLIEGGATPEEAIAAVRAARPGAIGTADQEARVTSYTPQW